MGARGPGRGLATTWTRTNSSLVNSDKQRRPSETAAAGVFFEFDWRRLSQTPSDPARVSQKAVSVGQSPLTAFLFQ